MAGQKIRIRLKSYDHEVIDVSARKIVDTVTRAGATVVGPVPLPTEKNVYCVIRSPVSYTHLTLPTMSLVCRYRWSPDH